MGKALAIAAAVVTFFVFHFTWWLAMIVGGGIWLWMRPTAESTVMVQTIDLSTGRTILQPQDKATLKYLSTRDDK